MRPEVGAQEDHRAGRPDRLVVVLGRVLEDLLDRPRRTRSEHDAVGRDREQAGLAHAVVEVLGDVRRERVGRLKEREAKIKRLVERRRQAKERKSRPK